MYRHGVACQMLSDGRQTLCSVQVVCRLRSDSVQAVTDVDRHTGSYFGSSCNVCIFLFASLLLFETVHHRDGPGLMDPDCGRSKLIVDWHWGARVI